MQVIRDAGGTAADPPRTVADAAAVADGLDDPRLRDLDETVRGFMAAADTPGTGGRATARLAVVLLGIAANGGRRIDLVASPSLDGLRSRLRGESRPEAPAMPRSLVALLDEAVLTWRTTSDADFWHAMAATAARPRGMPPVQHLREQAALLAVVAELGRHDVRPRWLWATAAEKADLVDVLITAGAGRAEPVEAVLNRVRTLTRGADPVPRAVAAELAQMAVAALAGVTTAPPPDRRGAVRLEDRPPGPNATAQEAADHRAREDLRSTAHALVALGGGTRDRLAAHLFRGRLSALYVDMREQARQYAPRSDRDLPGKARHRRLLEVLGPLDGTLVDALDRWSAALATRSPEAWRYVQVARAAQDAIEGVLGRMNAAGADTPLFPVGSPEQVRVGIAVRAVAVELGLEAGEVLLGDVAPPGDLLAGLRLRLAEVREDQKRLTYERDARMQGPLLATVALRPKYLAALGGPLVRTLTATATAFDAAFNTAFATAPPDPAYVEAAADHLLDAAQQARAAGAALRDFDRHEVVHLADLIQEIVAERLERCPAPLPAKGAALRATIPTLPLPAAGTSLGHSWTVQKAEVLATLPAEIAVQVSAAMNLPLDVELDRLRALAEAHDAATEEQGWTVLRILRAYKATASRMPVSRADAKARLHSVLDAIALSVLRQLPPPAGR
ncbi:hypothetical protein [Pseudonocardia adelaidensis]|uniref:Uncharacterized protein n=1 Tax=Pseudonocardia adelaidensis TaxID=648754 RepID=A0ABP9NW80_9PSEU